MSEEKVSSIREQARQARKASHALKVKGNTTRSPVAFILLRAIGCSATFSFSLSLPTHHEQALSSEERSEILNILAKSLEDEQDAIMEANKADVAAATAAGMRGLFSPDLLLVSFFLQT